MDPAKRLQEPELKLRPAHQGPGQQGKVLWASTPHLRISRISSKLPFIFPTLFWTQQFAISQLCPKTGRDPISNLNYPLVAKRDQLEVATHCDRGRQPCSRGRAGGAASGLLTVPCRGCSRLARGASAGRSAE